MALNVIPVNCEPITITEENLEMYLYHFILYKIVDTIFLKQTENNFLTSMFHQPVSYLHISGIFLNVYLSCTYSCFDHK